MISGERVLVAGTGLVGYPLARELARRNEVYGLSLFDLPGERERVEKAGVKPIQLDLGTDPLDALPKGVSYIWFLIMAHAKDRNWEKAVEVNGLSLARVVAHCRPTKAFYYMSSAAVYQYNGHDPITEKSALGNRSLQAGEATYSFSKYSGEIALTAVSSALNIPGIIGRLNVPYGPGGGWIGSLLDMIVQGKEVPLHRNQPNIFHYIYENDYVEKLQQLIEKATVPPRVVNLAGSDKASMEEVCAYLGQMVGRRPTFKLTDMHYGNQDTDVSLMNNLVGPTKVPWQDGMRRLAEARYPDLVRAAHAPARSTPQVREGRAHG